MGPNGLAVRGCGHALWFIEVQISASQMLEMSFNSKGLCNMPYKAGGWWEMLWMCNHTAGSYQGRWQAGGSWENRGKPGETKETERGPPLGKLKKWTQGKRQGRQAATTQWNLPADIKTILQLLCGSQLSLSQAFHPIRPSMHLTFRHVHVLVGSSCPVLVGSMGVLLPPEVCKGLGKPLVERYADAPEIPGIIVNFPSTDNQGITFAHMLLVWEGKWL